MTKQQFLSELQTKLSGLPQQDRDERIRFYDEMIDDRIEEGADEEAAVAGIGTADEVVAQILSDYPLAKIVKEKVTPKRRLKAWEIVLLILGSPIWLSLLIAALAVVLSLYISVWAVLIALWAVSAALGLCSLIVTVAAAVLSAQGNLPVGITVSGAGIFGIGFSSLMLLGCKAATKGLIVLTKKMVIGIKTSMIGKENNQ